MSISSLGFHYDFLFPTQTFRAVHRPAFWVRNCRDVLPSVGLQSVGKSSWSTLWKLSLSPRVQHAEAADKKEIMFWKFCACFVHKKSNELQTKKAEKVAPKTGPEWKPVFGAC